MELIRVFWSTIFGLFTLRKERSRILWHGEMPSFPIWARVFSRLRPGYKQAKILNFEDMVELGKRRRGGFEQNHGLRFLEDQLVRQNSEYETELIKRSGINYAPREIMQVRVFSKFGHEHVSKIVKGSRFSVGGVKELQKTIAELILKVRRERDLPVSIEINHTHPSVDLITLKEDKVGYLINGLGHSDLEITRKLAYMFNNIPLKVRAISASGVNFTCSFNH